MTMFIDNRIGAKELFRYMDMPAKLQRLEFADAAFTGLGPGGEPRWVGIERKRIGDLVSSIDTGRLAGHQLIGLLNSYHEIYLLIEGIWRTGSNGEIQTYKGKSWKPLIRKGNTTWTFKAVTKYINTLMVQQGIRVWITGNLGESGRYLSNLYHWWKMPWEKHTAINQLHKAPNPRDTLVKPSFLRRALAELEGVGWKRSGIIAAQVKTLHELCHMSVEDLMKLEGVGKVTAKSIRKEVRKKG
jgi:ERCC4-type nuclease